MAKGLPPSHCPEAEAAARGALRLRKKEELSAPVVTSSANGLPDVCEVSVPVEGSVDPDVSSVAASL